MKTIVVMSDSHGRLPKTERFLTVLDECDYIFHLGDGLADIDFLKKSYGGKVQYVLGNCDGGSGYKCLEIEKVKFFLTHGHDYGVKSTALPLVLAAQEQGARYALFGHTHIPVIEDVQGITLINPGSVGMLSTYCYITVSGGKAYAKTVYLQ